MPKKIKASLLKKGSSLEREASLKLAAAGIREWRREGRLLAPRRFVFDFYWPKERVILEVHGGQYKGGRHQSALGFARDRVKMNLAQLEGWTVIEACTSHVKSGEFVEWVREALV